MVYAPKLGEPEESIEREGSDRHNVTLPQGQLQLLEAIEAVGRPVTVVLINGGMVASSPVKARPSICRSMIGDFESNAPKANHCRVGKIF